MAGNPESEIWTPGRFRLFLSHISAEKQYIASVKAELATHEVDGFVAHEDIAPTRDWQDTIEVALAECQALAAFLHPTFHSSMWTDQEIGFVRSRGSLVIPIRLGTDPYGFLGRYQGLPGHDNPVEMARAIVDLLASHPLTTTGMGSSIVQMVETSPSYADARERVSNAEQFEHWTPDLLQRLEAAIDLNRQVGESIGVPKRIRRLVAEQRDLAGPESERDLEADQPARERATDRFSIQIVDAPEVAPPHGIAAVTATVSRPDGSPVAAARVRATVFGATFQTQRGGRWESSGQSWAGETSSDGTITVNVAPQEGADSLLVEFDYDGTGEERRIPIAHSAI